MKANHFQRRPGKQGGVVLIVSIVLLAIVSILAAFSTRNAASAENVSGNVRLTELATQAAELALRHCEDSVAAVIAADAGKPSSYPTAMFSLTNILPAGNEAWKNPAEWDSTTSPAYILPLDRVNQASLTATYKRPPECMAVRLTTVLPGEITTTNVAFLITARGFGPDVAAADLDRTRPVGSEVWLQSQIELH